MNEQKEYTRRELIIAKRDGFHEGAAARANDPILNGYTRIDAAAARRFPLEEERHRTVKAGNENLWFRFKDGQIQYTTSNPATFPNGPWECAESQNLRFTQARVKAANDVVNNPTEKVPL